MVLLAMYRCRGILCRTVKRRYVPLQLSTKNNKGIVAGSNNGNGHRNVADGRNTTGYSGARIISLLILESSRWLHADVVSIKNSRTPENIVQVDKESKNLSNKELSDNE